ncbi:MAG: hypothetical protein IKL53_02325 [Lachnospiraceae bacterium]|nr:hypothetical protein [Lachnospiraceae bacterium]
MKCVDYSKVNVTKNILSKFMEQCDKDVYMLSRSLGMSRDEILNAIESKIVIPGMTVPIAFRAIDFLFLSYDKKENAETLEKTIMNCIDMSCVAEQIRM